jgi:small subunit ribosomal protein S16
VSEKIRLMRLGQNKQPTYPVVVADGRSPGVGRDLEILGQYRPREEPSFFSVDDEKVLGWLRQGAQPSDQVHRLLVGAGIWERYESDRNTESRAVKTAKAQAKGAAAARADREAQAKAASEAEAKAAADRAAEASAAEAPAEEAAAEEAPAEDAATDEAAE